MKTINSNEYKFIICCRLFKIWEEVKNAHPEFKVQSVFCRFVSKGVAIGFHGLY
jgi:hypothetical protein